MAAAFAESEAPSASSHAEVLDTDAQRDLIQRSVHALTGGDASATRSATGHALRHFAPGSLEFGLLLHRFGDSYAHTILNEPQGWLGFLQDRGPDRLYPTGYGHLLDFHAPDQIEQRPRLYGQYVQDLFATLGPFAGKARLSSNQLGEFIAKMQGATVRTKVVQHSRRDREGFEYRWTTGGDIDGEATERAQFAVLKEAISSLVGPDAATIYTPLNDPMSLGKYNATKPLPGGPISEQRVDEAVHNVARRIGEDRNVRVR